MQNKNKEFDLFKFVEDIDMNTHDPDDLSDWEKGQIILTTRLFQTNKLFRLFISEMTRVFLRSSLSEFNLKKFIERIDFFIQSEDKIFKK